MVKVLNHALIKHKLSIMREEKTSNYIFKQNLDEIAMLMAYEVTKDYPLKEKEIETFVYEGGNISAVKQFIGTSHLSVLVMRQS